MELKELDTYTRNINAVIWRGVCLGYTEDNKPIDSPTTYSKYKKLAGLINHRGEPLKVHYLTQREAYLILVRSKIEFVCAVLGVPKPTDKEFTTTKLESICEKWLTTINGDQFLQIVLHLTNNDSVPLVKIKEILGITLGKPVSESTIRRRFKKANLDFSLKSSYTMEQIMKVYSKS